MNLIADNASRVHKKTFDRLVTELELRIIDEFNQSPSGSMRDLEEEEKPQKGSFGPRKGSVSRRMSLRKDSESYDIEILVSSLETDEVRLTASKAVDDKGNFERLFSSLSQQIPQEADEIFLEFKEEFEEAQTAFKVWVILDDLRVILGLGFQGR